MNRKIILAVSLLVICLSACQNSSNTETQEDSENTLAEETITPSANPSTLDSDSELIGSTPTGVKYYNSGDTDIVFIDSKTGWKADYSPGDTHQQNITLWKTSNEGETWDKITSTYDKDYTIPLETKTGLTFSDDKYGWITTITPKEGYIGLFSTTDGGYNWINQELKVPKKYNTMLFHTYPPVFFSENNGILLNDVFGESNEKIDPLVFVTDNKGASWKRLSQNDTKLDMKWTYSSDTNADVKWEVIYKNQVWQSRSGITWNMAK